MAALALRSAWNHVGEFIPKDKRIAVVVSGGWDSAILWYMTKRICMERGQDCTPYTVPKLDGAEHYANLVLAKTCELLDIPVIKTTIVGNINSENPSDYVTSGCYEILENGYADFLMSGMNAYPPNMQEMLPDNPLPNDRYVVNDAEKEYIGHPFADWTKDETVKLAFTLGIEHDIMNITHSCTELNRGRCNNCWWCKEREWGFVSIGLIDTGEE